MSDDVRTAQSYRAILHAMDEGFCIIEVIEDADGHPVDYRFLEANPAFEQQTGLSDAVGRTMRELAPDHEQHWFDIYGRIARTRSPQRFEDRADALGRLYDVYAFPVGEPEERKVAILFRDILDRTRAANALRESEARHRLLIGSWAQAVWETDPAGVVVTDSPSWRAYTGQTLEEWLGHGWLDAIHPDDRAYAERQWREAMAVRGFVNAEFRLHAPGGSWRWTNVRAVPVLDERGNIEKWAGMNIDIDDRKRAEAALRESEEKYRNLFNSIDEGFAEVDLITDDEGSVIDWRYLKLNPAFGGLTGMADVTGLLISEILPDLEPAWAEHYTQLLKSGEPVRFEEYTEPIDLWLEVHASLVDGPDSRRAILLFNNITTRKRAEAVLRESEMRQAYLLKLSDALRPLANPTEIQNAAMRVLGHHLGAFRAQYFEAESDGEHVNSLAGYSDPPENFVSSRILMDDFGSFVASDFQAGKTVIVGNTATDPRVSHADLRSYQTWGMGAYVAVPLVKGGRFVVCVGVHSDRPREWTKLEVHLIEETAERTWAAVERARVETSLRESEERFAQFANASSAGIWIRDAKTLAMEYISPAIATIYGVEPDAFLGDMSRWASMIVPEDRDIALRHVQSALEGESVVHEFRIQRPTDGAFRWIRNTDFPLGADGHVQRVGGIAEDITEEKLLTEHQGILLAELQHRVRNIMAIIRSIVSRTAEGAASVDDYAELLSGRLLTLARVQALLTRAANIGVGLATIVSDELSAQATHAGQFEIHGPDVELPPKAAETMTLAVHELTTNALKHGALSAADGCVRVHWSIAEKGGAQWLVFDWNESGAPESRPSSGPRRQGFGSELIEGRVPYELGGSGTVSVAPGGAQCHIEFPLKDGASILETDAPQQATVFGGALDMTGEVDLKGQRILIVEDEYYLANDTARAFKGAGADILGPCATEDSARSAIAEGAPTGAVLDINLRGGRSFDLAREFLARNVPFVFVTGYDQDVIPAEFDGIKRLQKPVEFREIVRELATEISGG